MDRRERKDDELDQLIKEGQIQSYILEEIDNDYDSLRIKLPSGDVISVRSNGMDGSYLCVDVY